MSSRFGKFVHPCSKIPFIRSRPVEDLCECIHHYKGTLLVARLVQALHYKPEGRGFNSRWCHWISHWHYPSGRTMALRSSHSLTKMSTRNIFWAVKTAGALDWQPYHLHVPIVLKYGSLNLLEPAGPVQAFTDIAFTHHYKYKRNTYQRIF
jgi:hypothetical protein